MISHTCFLSSYIFVNNRLGILNYDIHKVEILKKKRKVEIFIIKIAKIVNLKICFPKFNKNN